MSILPATRTPDSRANDDQAAVLEFLSDPAAYPSCPASVERHETHGAIVFLAGADAYKVKRAVRFAYLDYSSLERRHAMVEKEVLLNQRFAPSLYLGAVPVTRDQQGHFVIGGDGDIVEWCVHMRRFDQKDLLSARVAGKQFTLRDAIHLADTIADVHRTLDRVDAPDIAQKIASSIRDIAEQLSQRPVIFDPQSVERFRISAERERARAAHCLTERARSGHVRRCHGDLHLDNIVMLDGTPTLFDAIEFSDEIAVIDTLYDLAFPLMDLEHNACRLHANALLNRYLWRAGDISDIAGLVAMPLFLGLRAAIRAMVTAERAGLTQGQGSTIDAAHARAREQFGEALVYLSPHPPRLVAVGGYSGTGKSTLAATLAPAIGNAPGALHLRSDLERKALFGVAQTTRLPPDGYTREATQRAYAALYTKAQRALAAGHSVIVDAVFSHPDERHAIEAVARNASADFTGLWLTAAEATLKFRVDARAGDASDATAAVVTRQLQRESGPITWTVVDAGGSAADTAARAQAVFR